ncbi:caspase family protein [Patescibacteria group bacterium]|nr:caspase family protein [Patescibacteria group bacterium]MBU4512414.1 caspase family protein [Patescibacteria group bacterium]
MKSKFILVALIFVLGLSSFSFVSAKDNNGQTNMRKPLFASEMKIYHKASLTQGIGNTKTKPVNPPGLNKKKNSDSGATGVFGEPLADGADKYAVIIGVCDYQGTINDICDSDGDALNMYDALITFYGYDSGNIILLRDDNATFSAIDSAVKSIESLESAGDEVVFFFSGHGGDGMAQDYDKERKDEAIITHDLQYIWDGQLQNWFSGFDTNRIVFIFDSCLSGGMNDVASEGVMFVSASKENQLAYVYSTGVNGEGMFSHYFVNEAILQGLADFFDHDNNVAIQDVVIEEAFDYTRLNLPSIYQIPTIVDNFLDDLML